MTVQELYDSVAQLGFETTLENSDRFVFATNRAILQVNRVDPAIATYKLNHFPLKNVLKGENYSPTCKGEQDLVYSVEKARGYYFECNGNGEAWIEAKNDKGKWYTIEIVDLESQNGSFRAYKGKVLEGGKTIDSLVRIRFIGDYVYYVQNIAIYDALTSEKVEDIPTYGEFSTYDIASLTSDFVTFVKPPIADAKRDKAFILNQDYFIEEDGKIFIPLSVNGVYEIRYHRRPKQITSVDIDANKTIDLKEELCALLPNLVASYIWLDDEPEKAQYYYSLYTAQVSEIMAQKKAMKPFVYRNKTGW